MKKTIILSALCMLFAVSCSKGIVEIDENNVNNPSKNLEKKTFSIENDVTRTFIDGKIIKWEVGDKIGIMDNIDNTVVREFSVESVSEDGRKAIITGEVTQGADFFAAVYPVDAANSVDFQSSKITFTIPSSQTLSTSCNHDKLAIVSAAFLDNGKFIFKNAFSLLKFKMTQENVSKVILRNTGSAPLAGTSTIDFSDDLSVTIAGTTKSITLSGEFENEKEYYIALAPCQMAGTMELFFASDEKQSIAYKTTEKTFTFERNGGYNIGAVEPIQINNPIITKADLIGFAKYADVFGNYSVKLGADIDLENEEWIPIKQFVGEFDGQCHRVYNLKVAEYSGFAALFNTLGPGSKTSPALIKNLCVGSQNYDFSTGEGEADGSSSVVFNATDDSKWEYAAGVVAYVHTGATVENCVNFVPVSVNESAKTRWRIGGIAGTMKANTTIKNCINHANITSSATKPTTVAYSLTLGGIVGIMDGEKASIINCTNKGNIKNLCTYVDCVGGIVGVCSYLGQITECENNGIVENAAASFNTSSGYAIRVGGIIGSANGDPLVVTKCTNTASVTQSVCPQERSMGIGGIVGVAGGSIVIKGCTNSGNPSFTGKGLVGSNLCVGGIIGYTTGGEKSSIITKADDGTINTNSGFISICDDFAGTIYFGGIAGYFNQDVTQSVIEYCENNGEIKGNKDKLVTAITCSMGGIAGCPKCSIYHCKNTGIIVTSDNNNTTTFYLGGIAANGNYIPEITNCSNEAEYIQMSKGKASKMYFGGICGATKAFSTKMRDCYNTGELRTSRGNTVYTGGLVGYLDMTGEPDITNFEGCTAKYLNNASTTSREKGYVGMLFGGLMKTPTNILTIGSSSSPCKVGGDWKDYNTHVSEKVTSDNLTKLLFGQLEANQDIATQYINIDNIQLY